jgi:peptidoglycan/xylan/chitin deacetylase (PgdA/CDA1 family)
MSLSGLLKRTTAWGLLRSGVLSLRGSLGQRHTAIVLMYHRVNDERDPFFPALPVATFVAQVEYLARQYRIEPLAEIVDWLETGAPGRARIALTIDDGYPDTHACVLPVLARVGAPATLFLATAPVETGQPLWLDRVRWILRDGRGGLPPLPAPGLEPLPLETPSQRLAALRRLLRAMKRLPPATIEATVAELERRLDPQGPPPGVLDWERVRRMAAGPIEVGAHTHRHYMLSRLEDAEVEAEIETSVRLIQERLGRTVTTFAYPNGEPEDYDARAVRALQRLGLRCAVTTRDGSVRPGQPRYELPRLYTSEPFLPLFAARVAGLRREAS